MSNLIQALGLQHAANEAGEWLQRRLSTGQVLQIVTCNTDEMSAPSADDEGIIAVIWSGSFDQRDEEIWGCTLENIAAELHERGYTDFI